MFNTYTISNPANGIILCYIQARSNEHAREVLVEQTPYDPDRVAITLGAISQS